MAKPQGLLQRGTRWYSNFKVPPDLIAVFGKELIRESLRTSDYKEACRKIAYERVRWMAKFDHERRKIVGHDRPNRREKRLIGSLSDQEAFEMALSYLASRERGFRDWMLNEGRYLPPSELAELQWQVGEDAAFYAEGRVGYPTPDGTEEVKRFLEAEGVECAETSPAFLKLRPLIYQAHLEHLERSEDLVKGRTMEERTTYSGAFIPTRRHRIA